jgi:putative ABC transport system substrate-binding protein
MMRRELLAFLGSAASLWPFPALAQQGAKMPRIGFLSPRLDTTAPLRDAFIEGLRELGYIEGRNILIDYTDAEGSDDRLPGLAAELVARNVDIIVVPSTPAAKAAKRATATVPIVLAWVVDPVGSGLVASPARPGSNVTGLSFLATDLVGKRLELLKEAAPEIGRIAVLWHPGDYGEQTERDMLQRASGAARALGVQLQVFAAEGAADFQRAFSEMRAASVDAVSVQSTNVFFRARQRLAELMTQNRLPSVYLSREFVDAGGLMSYAPNVADLFRRAATYVDKILKGTKPADLPVEQPTKFELVINLRTAKALGLTVPQSLLARADEVID